MTDPYVLDPDVTDPYVTMPGTTDQMCESEQA